MKDSMTIEEFHQALKPHCTGPEHNDYYVVADALQCCLNAMEPYQREQAIESFHQLTVQTNKGLKEKYPKPQPPKAKAIKRGAFVVYNGESMRVLSTSKKEGTAWISNMSAPFTGTFSDVVPLKDLKLLTKELKAKMDAEKKYWPQKTS